MPRIFFSPKEALDLHYSRRILFRHRKGKSSLGFFLVVGVFLASPKDMLIDFFWRDKTGRETSK